jgi:hypothetical protein
MFLTNTLHMLIRVIGVYEVFGFRRASKKFYTVSSYSYKYCIRLYLFHYMGQSHRCLTKPRDASRHILPINGQHIVPTCVQLLKIGWDLSQVSQPSDLPKP